MPGENFLKILFVVNPGSGSKNTPWERLIGEHFATLEHEVVLHHLSHPPDIASLQKCIDEEAPHRVVAVGGDGTVSLVAKILLNKNIALGILPAGSANGMATELAIPSDPDKAILVVHKGSVKNADVVQINDDRVSLHLSDLGLNARLIKHFDEGNLRGKLGYAKALIKTLLRKTRMEVQVCTDGQNSMHEAEMVVLANASRYGTGAVINPGGSLYDGKFEVVIMRQLAMSELFKMWFRFRPFDARKMTVLSATSVSIHTRRKVHFQIDGEYVGRVQHVEAKILPGQLKLIVP